MKAVKDLCVRLINRKTFSKEEISEMCGVYLEKRKLTDSEYEDIMKLINNTY